MIWVCESLGISQLRAFRVLGQARSTQRHEVGVSEERLVARIIVLATRYGRYGYRRITALLRAEEWWVNHKRDLEAGGVKGTSEATQEGEVMAQ